MVTDVKLLRAGARLCCGPIVVLLVIAALGPGKWTPRTALGWQFDHMIGYFGITLFFCFAWSRPLVVGGVIMAVAALLEGLQAFTPDRSAYLPAALYGAGGAMMAALLAELLMRAWRRHVDIARGSFSFRFGSALAPGKDRVTKPARAA